MTSRIRSFSFQSSKAILLTSSLILMSSCTISEEKIKATSITENTAYAFTPAVQTIMTTVCADCHSGAGNGNFNGSVLGSPTKMTTTSASFGGKFIIPGNPTGSVIYQKILGTAASGARMPIDGPPYLDATQQEAVRSWIANMPTSFVEQEADVEFDENGEEI